ncbi:phage tail protein [Mycolicibacterium sp. XJ1819]
MSTPVLLGEPFKIGDRDVRLGFWGMPRNPDDPRRVNGTFTLIDGEGDVVLDVFIGPKGDPGEPMPPWRIEWDSTVDNIGDLPAVETLDESDNGRAWVIGTTLYVYVHDLGAYRTLEAGIQGPRGLTPNISMSAELVEAADPDNPYGEAEVVESGTSDSPHFHLLVPGLRGPEGPSTNIRGAPDYDDTDPPLDGQGVVWDETLEKFRPGDLSPFAAKMYTIPHANFIDYSGTAGRQLIASLDIEAQDVAWYPDVMGHVRIQRNFLSSAQVEVEIRIGDTGVGTGETAPLCGLGPYDPSWALLDSFNIAHIKPHFSDVGNPVRAIAPDSADGRVPAGQAKTIYVFLHKLGGTGTYTFAANEANQLRVNLLPVS